MKNKKLSFTNINKKLLQQQKRISKYMKQQDCITPELEMLFIKNMELMTDIIEKSQKLKKESVSKK
jgi:hypothetical protein